jgi:hypothetical protein
MGLGQEAPCMLRTTTTIAFSPSPRHHSSSFLSFLLIRFAFFISVVFLL